MSEFEMNNEKILKKREKIKSACVADSMNYTPVN